MEEGFYLEKHIKIIGNVPEDKTFDTGYGSIKNLSELKTMLADKGEEFYKEYVNEKDNHFANWIECVVEDKKLAFLLRNSSYDKTVRLIEERIKYAKLWLKFNADDEKFYDVLSNKYEKSVEPEDLTPADIKSDNFGVIAQDFNEHYDVIVHEEKELEKILGNEGVSQENEKVVLEKSFNFDILENLESPDDKKGFFESFKKNDFFPRFGFLSFLRKD